VAAVGDGRMFARGRDMAAWLGLVPRQHSTGGKPTLGSISKRGNTYLRELFIQGAQSSFVYLKRDQTSLGQWLRQVETRRQRQVPLSRWRTRWFVSAGRSSRARKNFARTRLESRREPVVGLRGALCDGRTVKRRTVSLSDKPVACDRRRYEDRCARIPSRPGTNGFHKQAGYITATVFAIASKCDLQRRGRPYIYRELASRN
jgi:hypothetical protein